MSCEVSPSCVLGALIRNGMGILLLLSIPYVLLNEVYDYVFRLDFYVTFTKRPSCQRLSMLMNLIRCKV
ncbi:hypothetical protein MtrunA17_Chr6g0476011 [Medicago truncatula]|uniref:Transmembrane protein n=1 Tax=Medicago truncatula TaxID=3880 RepID=A0A396HMF4_MEDTR|nr:hypothetical protein MtrunA17_Chr6g0476011 [Medicago truncatula]